MAFFYHFERLFQISFLIINLLIYNEFKERTYSIIRTSFSMYFLMSPRKKHFEKERILK